MMVIIVCLLVTGCSEYKIELTERLLKNKYDTEVVVDYTTVSSISNNSRSFEADCSLFNEPDIQFTATVYEDKNTIDDDFEKVALLYDMNKAITPIIANIGTDYEVLIDTDSDCEGYWKTRDIITYNKVTDTFYNIVVAINLDESLSVQPNEIMSTLQNICEAVGNIDGSFSLYLVDSEVIRTLRQQPRTVYSFENHCESGIGFRINIESSEAQTTEKEIGDRLFRRNSDIGVFTGH